MKNKEIIEALNGLSAVTSRQTKLVEDGKGPILSLKGQFALSVNNKALVEAYKPYEETLKSLQEKYKLPEDKEVSDDEKNANQELFMKEVEELLDLESDVTLRTITEQDFIEGAIVNDIMALAFMLSDSVEADK